VIFAESLLNVIFTLYIYIVLYHYSKYIRLSSSNKIYSTLVFSHFLPNLMANTAN